MRINPGGLSFWSASVISRKHPRGGASWKSLAELVLPSGFVQLRRHQGFTLVEIMIVVAVIGLLAAIAVPNFVRARENAQNGAYMADLRTATGAFQEYAIINGAYPADRLPGQMPNGMADYLVRMKWTERNSLGGRWDWDYGVFGVTAGVSVHTPSASAEQLIRLDRILDNGDLASGHFRQRPSGYIAVIED